MNNTLKRCSCETGGLCREARILKTRMLMGKRNGHAMLFRGKARELKAHAERARAVAAVFAPKKSRKKAVAA